MRVNLWNSPYNGGWIWFDRRNLSRCQAGRNGCKIWWAVFGFCGSIYLQTWPWQKVPCSSFKDLAKEE